jgi:NAD(P)-dependent dehydrogenase (short-subunit alcohol dehydrogenase family)
MSGRLSDKVCVITGTGGSIGRASALMFAREGALVVGCGQTVESAAETVDIVHAAGGEMVSMQPCQLTEPADCQALVDLAGSRTSPTTNGTKPDAGRWTWSSTSRTRPGRISRNAAVSS